MRQDCRHHLARHVRRQKSVAVFGEHCGDPNRVVDTKADKPAKHQIVLHLLHQLALGSNREQDLDQAGPDQPLGGDRRTAEIDVEWGKLAIEAGEGVIDHLPDLAQRMLGWDALLEIDIAKQRPALFIRPTRAMTESGVWAV